MLMKLTNGGKSFVYGTKVCFAHKFTNKQKHFLRSNQTFYEVFFNLFDLFFQVCVIAFKGVKRILEQAFRTF